MTTTTARAPLTRPRRVVLGGVCEGLARHLGWPLAWVRVGAVALAALGGSGILLYFWLWAFTPLAPSTPRDAGVRRAIPVAAIAVGCAGVAAFIAVAWALGWAGTRVPVAIGVGGGPNGGVVGWYPLLDPGTLETVLAASLAVTWSLSFDRNDPARTERYGVIVRSIAAGLMIALGGIQLLTRPTALAAVVAVFMIVLGTAVLFIPRVVALWAEVIAERSGRVREEQRAEIAAHLHDSVLQTLALIQNRAGASSEVARLARAQERELRDWLFAGTGPVSEDLATELREIAASIELDYPVRLDVVTTGETAAASAAIVAAAREAMLNAARHAGGEVSVYLETSGESIDVFVRDRGPGVDLATLSSDRLGIRESIIGRLARAGGRATVTPGAGGIGTEVHLHLAIGEGAS